MKLNANQKKRMKIRITWLATGAVLDLQESDSILGPQTTFLEIKGFIKMRYGFKPQQLLLVCDQVLCEDDETLKQYGIVSTETAEKKIIGCHVFSTEEAEKEQKELEQEKAFEEEQKKRDAKRAEEAKKKREEKQQQQREEGDGNDKKEDDEKEQEQESKQTAKKKTSSILSYNHEDYQKALKILGKEKFSVSSARMNEVSHGNAPTHRPKFLDEQKSAKQMQFLQQAAKDAENAFGAQKNNNNTFVTGGAPNYMDMVRPSPEWRGREADQIRRIFKFSEHGDRRKEADAFFKIDYPNYPDGAIELWDVREDIMASIATGADQKPLIIELFYFCEVEKGVDMNKLGELVQMKLEQRGLRVKLLGVREAGCTYPLVAVAVYGETPAELFQLGEVFFEEFGNPDAVTSEPAMQSTGDVEAREGCVVQ